MTVNNTATRDVYRPTMRRELLTPNNKGTEVIMVDTNSNPAPPEPEAEPFTVVSASSYSGSNSYVVGSTITGITAEFSGGRGREASDVSSFRYRWQLRDSEESEVDNTDFVTYNGEAIDVQHQIAKGGQIRLQSQARDDVLDNVNSYGIWKNIESPSTLVYSNPVVTGEPWVGETLRCSEPVVSGGVGPYQFDYFWVDETNAIVWEASKMQPNTIVTTYDIGKMMKCLVVITDKGWSGGESITVESNSIGPIGQRTIGTVVYTVDTVPIAVDEPIATMQYQEHVIVMQPDGNVANPEYIFDLRSGQARLTPAGNSCIVITQGDPPGSVQIQCSVKDLNTVEQQVGQRLVFVIGE